jgi:hypothetical protein
MKMYLLRGHEAVETQDPKEWNRSFARDHIIRQDHASGVMVSTIFLGLDHNFGDGPPLLFETMVFSGRHAGVQERYSTWDEAVDGHARWVETALPHSWVDILTAFLTKKGKG